MAASTCPASTSASTSARMSAPSSASSLVSVSGGAMRSSCRTGRPCRPAARAAGSSSEHAGGGRRCRASGRRGRPARRPIIRPSPAHLADDAELVGQRAQERRAGGAPDSRRWPAGRGRAGSRGWRAPRRDTSGLPPNVEIELAVQAVHHLAPRDDARQRQPVADALGEGEHVGRDAVGLVAPEVLAGAAPAGLHLVGDEQDPVLVEHLLHRAEEAVGRDGEPAHALDRLGDQAGHVAGGGRREHVAQVVARRRRCSRRRSRSPERAAEAVAAVRRS